jgi:hypothetical protein
MRDGRLQRACRCLMRRPWPKYLCWSRRGLSGARVRGSARSIRLLPRGEDIQTGQIQHAVIASEAFCMSTTMSVECARSISTDSGRALKEVKTVAYSWVIVSAEASFQAEGEEEQRKLSGRWR